jgi:hypothetical protein
MNDVPDTNLGINFVNNVGGLFGLGTTQCKAKAIFNQNHFYPGSLI